MTMTSDVAIQDAVMHHHSHLQEQQKQQEGAGDEGYLLLPLDETVGQECIASPHLLNSSAEWKKEVEADDQEDVQTEEQVRSHSKLRRMLRVTSPRKAKVSKVNPVHVDVEVHEAAMATTSGQVSLGSEDASETASEKQHDMDTSADCENEIVSLELADATQAKSYPEVVDFDEDDVSACRCASDFKTPSEILQVMRHDCNTISHVMDCDSIIDVIEAAFLCDYMDYKNGKGCIVDKDTYCFVQDVVVGGGEENPETSVRGQEDGGPNVTATSITVQVEEASDALNPDPIYRTHSKVLWYEGNLHSP